MIASMLVREASRFDEEQAFILQEALRFFDHQNSDIRGFSAMAPSWPALVQRLRAGAEIKPSEADVADALRSWHQAQAHFCVALTRELGMPFTLKLSRQHWEEQRLRWTEDLATFVETKQLFLDFEVPDAPGPLGLTVDILKRNVICHLSIAAPATPKQYAGKINWLLRQLPQESDESAVIHIVWKHGGRTSAPLGELRLNPSAARLDREGAVPRIFQIVVPTDLDKKFGPQNFPAAVEAAMLDFHETVVRHIRPPKPSRVAEEPETENGNVADAWMSAEERGPEPRAIETGNVDGRTFAIFDDGSVEIETAGGMKRFDSVAQMIAAAERN